MAGRVRLRRLGAELFIVVLGVIIALAADSWREGLAESRVEARYLNGLAQDISEGLSTLGAIREWNAVLAAAAYDLAESMAGDTPPLDDDAFLETLFRATQVGFDPQDVASDATFQELLASGTLSTLRDANLREGVVEFYRGFDLLVENLDELQERVPVNDRVAELTGFFPYALSQQCLFSGPFSSTVCGEARSLSPVHRERLLSELRHDPQLAKDLRHLHAELTILSAVIDRVSSQGQDLMADLERAR